MKYMTSGQLCAAAGILQTTLDKWVSEGALTPAIESSGRGVKRQAVKAPKELESHALLDLLNDPNDLQVAWSLWYFTVASLELTGKCLWWRTKVDGREQLLPLPTSWITGMRGLVESAADHSLGIRDADWRCLVPQVD